VLDMTPLFDTAATLLPSAETPAAISCTQTLSFHNRQLRVVSSVICWQSQMWRGFTCH